MIPAISDRIVLRQTGSLVPYARNARTHSAEQVAQIAASMREFGFTNPVLIDADGGIVAGHGRVMAAQQLGLDQVPCIELAHLTPEQRRAYVLADNQLALNAGWDEELLRAEVAGLEEAGFDLRLLGFSDEYLGELMAEEPADGLTDQDATPEPAGQICSRLGDRWLLGRHRIVCGDSTNADTVALAIGDDRPRLMVTDPPYGVEYDPAWRVRVGVSSSGAAVKKVTNDHRADWRDAWALFPGAVAYVWHGGLHADVVYESLRACGFGIRAQIVWVKTRHVLSRGHYHGQHEPCAYAVREGEQDDWRFVPEHEVAAYAVRDGAAGNWKGGRKQSTVWFIEHLRSDTGHSTQKPVECMRRPIENNSARGQWVYEPFSGSGTTLIACEIAARNCIAIELEPEYVDIAVRRWQDYTGMQAKLAVTGQTFDEVAAERAKAEVK